MSDEPRCETCRFWGRTQYANRTPPGQCCRHAPDAYDVREQSSPGPSGVFVLRVVESPFPGVWPGDWCGEYEPKV